MVSEMVVRQPSTPPAVIVTNDEDDVDSLKQDIVSICSSLGEDGSLACNNSIALQEDHNVPTFGNIAVSNSSEIHFGNKTYYQGPVTIKKIVYAGTEVPVDESIANGGVADTNEKNEIGDNGDCAISDNKLGKTGKIPDTTLKKSSFIDIRYKKPLLITILVCVLILGISIVVLVFLRDNTTPTKYPTDSTEQDNRTPIDNPLDPAELPPQKVKIITRREWLAQSPTNAVDKLVTPVPNVIIMHSATDNCTDQSSCTFIVKRIQKFHIESRKWFDIGYNFLVGGDGYVYEGRGWTSEGSHTMYYNKKSIGIAFIGTFTNYLPPRRQITAALNLISLGVNESYILPDYKLIAARQVSSTESPGILLFEQVKTWPHWAKEP